jgi:hypothetical protein
VIPADADKVQRYVRRALINAALRIAHTGAGGRHQAIVEEASSIGRYAAAGLISDTEVLECLVGAALTAGKGEAEARRTVAQQLEWARAYPKVPVLT